MIDTCIINGHKSNYANTITWKILCYLSNDPSSTATIFNILTLFGSCHFSVMDLSQKDMCTVLWISSQQFLMTTPHDNNTLTYPVAGLHIILDIMMQFIGHISAIPLLKKNLNSWRVKNTVMTKKTFEQIEAFVIESAISYI